VDGCVKTKDTPYTNNPIPKLRTEMQSIIENMEFYLNSREQILNEPEKTRLYFGELNLVSVFNYHSDQWLEENLLKAIGKGRKALDLFNAREMFLDEHQLIKLEEVYSQFSKISKFIKHLIENDEFESRHRMLNKYNREFECLFMSTKPEHFMNLDKKVSLNELFVNGDLDELIKLEFGVKEVGVKSYFDLRKKISRENKRLRFMIGLIVTSTKTKNTPNKNMFKTKNR
jgi:hypothetical protein